MSDENRSARPWDLWNKKIGRVPPKVARERMEICSACPKLIPITHQCKICKCFMSEKTKLPNADCPLNKWGRYNYEEEVEK